jgi:hypothetical protein
MIIDAYGCVIVASVITFCVFTIIYMGAKNGERR